MRSLVVTLTLFGSGCIDFSLTRIVGNAALVATIPADAELDVATTTSLTLLFSDAIETDTLVITADPPISFMNDGFWDDSDKRVTTFPSAALTAGTVYTLTIKADTVNTGALNATLRFTTAADAIGAASPPTIVSQVPANGAEGVTLKPSISITFSKSMADAKVELDPPVELGMPTWYEANTVLTYPATAAELSPTKTYTMTVHGLSTDGQQLATSTSTWKTLTPADHDPPRIVDGTPGDLANGVPLGTSISVVFNEPVKTETVSLIVTKGVTTVGCPVTFDDARLIASCKPSAKLPTDSDITVTVLAGVHDDADNAMTANAVRQFHTGLADDTIVPTMSATPTEGRLGVNPVGLTITLTFSESMNTTLSFSVADQLGTPILGELKWDETTALIHTKATWTPSNQIDYNKDVHWHFTGDDGTAENVLDQTGMFSLLRQRVNYPIYALSGAIEGHIAQNGGPWAGIYMGDWNSPADVTLRSYITFDLYQLRTGLPADIAITIQNAQLKMFLARCVVDNVNVTTNTTAAQVSDDLNAPLFIGTRYDTLTAADFTNTFPAHTAADSNLPECVGPVFWNGSSATCAKDTRYDTFTPYTCLPGYKTIGISGFFGAANYDVGPKVRWDWQLSASRSGRSQWALEYDSNTDSQGDMDLLVFYGGSDSQSVRPQLVVTYTFP